MDTKMKTLRVTKMLHVKCECEGVSPFEFHLSQGVFLNDKNVIWRIIEAIDDGAGPELWRVTVDNEPFEVDHYYEWE